MTTRNQIALTGIAFSSLLAGSILAACGGGAPGATSTPQAAVTGGGGNDPLYGSYGDDTVAGGDGNDSLHGDTGNDKLYGGANDDSLDGGAGADTMVGGLGNDTYVVDDALDVVTEAASGGTDSVQTLLASLTLATNVENLTYTGSSNFTGTGNAAANVITGAAGFLGKKLSHRLAGNVTLTGRSGKPETITKVTLFDVVEPEGPKDKRFSNRLRGCLAASRSWSCWSSPSTTT